jgi:hypothetical protein
MGGMKKALAIAAILLGSVVLLLGAFLVINGVQRDQAYKTVRTYVLQSDQTRQLVTVDSKRVSVTCHPEGSTFGKCQAVEYKVSRDQCVRAVRQFKPNETSCNAEINITNSGNQLKVIAGSLYGTDDLQVQIILNEPHLLFMWK